MAVLAFPYAGEVQFDGEFPVASGLEHGVGTRSIAAIAEKYGGTVSDVVVETGNTLTVPAAPTQSGYTFSGWYENSELTSLWDFSTDTVTGDFKPSAHIKSCNHVRQTYENRNPSAIVWVSVFCSRRRFRRQRLY